MRRLVTSRIAGLVLGLAALAEPLAAGAQMAAQEDAPDAQAESVVEDLLGSDVARSRMAFAPAPVPDGLPNHVRRRLHHLNTTYNETLGLLEKALDRALREARENAFGPTAYGQPHRTEAERQDILRDKTLQAYKAFTADAREAAEDYAERRAQILEQAR